MRIATFNINGVKARIQALCDWLDEAKPDVALLQEIKSIDEAFPREPFEDRGYNVETHGQKGFNGVAILSKLPLEDVSRGLPGDDSDEQARWIEATVTGDGASVRLCGLYLPNGNPAPGPKYDYKLAWMARMRSHAAALLKTEMPVVLAGDYNVIPLDEDAAHPEGWREDALALPASRDAFRRILNIGYTEAIRARTAAHGALFLLGLPGRGLGPGQRHPDRPSAPQPAGGRPDDRRGHRPACAGAGEAVGSRASLDRSGGLSPGNRYFAACGPEVFPFWGRRLRRRRGSHWGRRLRRRPGARGLTAPSRSPVRICGKMKGIGVLAGGDRSGQARR
jgi:exodeoxyribonuclease-3